MRLFPIIAIIILLAGNFVFAGSVTLTNGDRITGEIINAENGKLTIKTEYAGELSIPLKSLSSIKSDKELLLKAGEIDVVGKLSLENKEQVITDKNGKNTKFVIANLVSLSDPNIPEPVPVAEKIEEKPKPKWTKKISLGVSAIDGNTDESKFNINGEASKKWDDYNLDLYAKYRYEEKDSDKTVNEITSGVKLKFYPDPKWYIYGSVDGEKDEFEDINMRLNFGSGLGYPLINGEKFKLDIEVGGAFVFEDHIEADNESKPSVRAAETINWQVLENLKVTNTFEIIPKIDSFGDFLANGKLATHTKVSSKIVWEVSLEVKFDSEPETQVSDTDTTVSTSLVFNW